MSFRLFRDSINLSIVKAKLLTLPCKGVLSAVLAHLVTRFGSMKDLASQAVGSQKGPTASQLISANSLPSEAVTDYS